QVNLMMSGDGGKTFGKKIRIDEGKSTGRVDVLSFASGEAMVSWIEHPGQGAQLHMRRVAANGTPGAVMNVSGTVGASSSGFPRMVASGSDIIAAWTDSTEPSQLRSAVIK